MVRGCRYLHISLLLVVGLIGVFAGTIDGGPSSTQPLVFRTNSDTIQFCVGESCNTFDTFIFSDLNRYDTTILGMTHPLTLISDIDTLVIRCSHDPVNLMIIKPGDTVYETIQAFGAVDSILTGTAEDLWGNSIDLSCFNKGLILIESFSPSNCGYCLSDGEFIKANYFAHNGTPGANFYQSVFSPQLDNYAFLKHYRSDTIPALTFPVTLHRYQKLGFPYLIAFRDGKLLYSGSSNPYDDIYKSLVPLLWPRQSAPSMHLTSPYKISDNIIYETKSPVRVIVLPDQTDEARIKKIQRQVDKTVIVRREKDLTAEDLTHHLEFGDKLTAFTFATFKNRQMPIQLDGDSLRIGTFTFPKGAIGLHAAIPNPFAPTRYIILKLSADNCREFVYQSWTDFAICRCRPNTDSCEVLMDGFFAKGKDNAWRFADSLIVTYANLKDYCKGGVCPLPREGNQEHVMRSTSSWETTYGTMASFGTSGCRFPNIAADVDGTIGIAWEERGNILLGLVKPDGQRFIQPFENSDADSYNPQIVWDGQSFFVAYLCDRERQYRLYGRYLDGENVSDEVPLSVAGSYDIMMPSLASDGRGKIIAAWTEWKANSRYPRFRIINNRTPGPVTDARIVDTLTDGYVNAWYYSLCLTPDGRLYAAWNQHYPSILGVCAGNLVDKGSSVTHLDADELKAEIGGYPATLVDRDGKQWVFWQSGAFTTYSGKPQSIRAAFSSGNHQNWSIPFTLSFESQTFFNQTPKATLDSAGSIWVVWSGRPQSPDGQWGIYLAHFVDGRWSSPIMISEPGVCGRAPNICIGKDNTVWIVWHSGIGEKMVIRLLHYKA